MPVTTGILTIDLGALAANYETFKKKAGKTCEAAAVVKADGYGLGIRAVTKTLLAHGCKTFFIATPEEGATLRGLAPGARIYVLNGLLVGAEDYYREHALIPVIGSLESLARAKSMEVALHFDTGMSRLGFGADETEILLSQKEKLDRVTVSMVVSHFACSDQKDHPMNEGQFKKFAEIAKHFPDAKKSLSNSSGVFRDKKYNFDLLRPGMALYGLNPKQESKIPVKPVVTLESQVLQVRAVKKGESAGYGASHVFDKDTVTATVSIGYADGFLRSSSNKGYLFWKGQPLPIRGRVSMDTTIVDLGALPENKRPVPGDMLEVIGKNQSADDVAALAGTIGYEILTSLGNRYARVYLGA